MNATSALTASLTAAMKPHAGAFKKEKLNYRRRHGETLQIVNFQLSQGNSVNQARCYVNVGVAFDAVFALTETAAPNAIKEYEAHFRARLENLVPDAPAAWVWDDGSDPVVVEQTIGAALKQTIHWLDLVDGPAAMLANRTLTHGTENFLAAQLRYCLGDLEGALASVQAGVAFFADRGSTVEEEIRELRLEKLMNR